MSIYNETEVLGDFSVGNDLNVGGDATINGDINVAGKVNAYNTKQYNVGVFGTLQELQEAYPSSETQDMVCVPTRGWVAGVMAGNIIKLYNYNGSSWVDTGFMVDLNIVMNARLGDYALKSYVDQQLGLKADNGLVTRSLQQKANASEVYTKTEVEKLLGKSVSEAVCVTFNVETEGMYDVINSDAVQNKTIEMIVSNGESYINKRNVKLAIGHNDVLFVFREPQKIPNGAFKGIEHIEKLHVPSFVHDLGTNTFEDTELNAVELECMTPPSNASSAFENIQFGTNMVKVHSVSLSSYMNDAYFGSLGDALSVF